MKRTLSASTMVLALSGCASIFNGTTQSVIVTSLPEGAAASITNRAGERVHTGVTPVTLVLNRGAGYFKPEIYKVTLSKNGFATKELTITSSVSGWYIGNILFGGLIGMLAVDPATGAMYTFPPTISGTLDVEGSKTSLTPHSLTIVSLDSLTSEQRARARLLAGPSIAQ